MFETPTSDKKIPKWWFHSGDPRATFKRRRSS